MESDQLLTSGDRFLDRWLIEEQVGKGGFSRVYRATDAAGRIAAVKVFKPEGGNTASSPSYDDGLQDRFLREARLLEQLTSAYTIQLWEHGTSPEGLRYMVFEFIDGRMLFDEIRDHGALDEDRVIHILRQTLIGLESAHAAGILHRDIKPNNIMLYERDDDPDRVKLVDFGIAKSFDDERALPGNDLTAAGLLIGTPRYMSPEQLRGRDLAPTSDLYSLGLCAVEMLTGRKCIPGSDRVKIVEAQLRPEPVRLPEDIEANPGLVAVVHKLTEKSLELRYESATEALRDLEQLAGDPGATGDTVYHTVPIDFGSALNQPADEDDATVFETINTAELASLIDRQKKKSEGLEDSESEVDPFGNTVAATDLVPPELRAMREQLNEPSNPTVDAKPYSGAQASIPESDFLSQFQTPAPDASTSGGFAARPPSGPSPHGSGQFQQPPPGGAHGSGQFQQPPPPGGAYGSGQFQQPPPPGGAYGSGQFQQPPQGAYGSGQFQQPGGYGSGPQQAPGGPYGSGQLQPPPLGDPYGSGQLQTPYGQSNYRPPSGPMQGQSGPHQPPQPQQVNVPFDSDDKLAIGASVIVPGVGQILSGQYVKGAIVMFLTLVIVVFSKGIFWLPLAMLSFADTFLLIRAQKLRPVGKFEFFADVRSLL